MEENFFVLRSLPGDSDLCVLESWLERCYASNDQGRIVAAQESGSEGRLPRFILAYAREGVIWRIRSDMDDALVCLVTRLATREKGLHAGDAGSVGGLIDSRRDTPARPDRLDAIVRLMGVHGGIDVEVEHIPVEVDGRWVGHVWALF